LLRISRAGGAIHCEISVHDIDDAPAYRALSYTWGPPEPAYNIVIDNKSLAIRDNLYAFLLKASKGEARRQLASTQYLWIDQISIDQENVSERNHQVRLMAKIYERAAVVTMWLGDTMGPECDDGPLTLGDQNKLWTPEAVAELLRDPYFTRLWIVQEVLLNPNIEVQVRGNAQLGFDTLVSARYFWRPKLRQLGVSRNTLDLLIRYYTNGPRFGELKQLHYLIEMFGKNKCTDLRDKVYGLVGMCNGTHDIVVDYSKSTQEVFLDVVTTFWRMFRKTRRKALKVRLPSRTYRVILEELGKEMILEQHQQRGIRDMLWHLWVTIMPDVEDYDYSMRRFPVVTSMGFDAATTDTRSSASLDGKLQLVPDQWWYECDKEKYVFKCIPPSRRSKSKPTPFPGHFLAAAGLS
jgi:hypothetical protein